MELYLSECVCWMCWSQHFKTFLEKIKFPEKLVSVSQWERITRMESWKHNDILSFKIQISEMLETLCLCLKSHLWFLCVSPADYRTNIRLDRYDLLIKVKVLSGSLQNQEIIHTACLFVLCFSFLYYYILFGWLENSLFI